MLRKSSFILPFELPAKTTTKLQNKEDAKSKCYQKHVFVMLQLWILIVSFMRQQEFYDTIPFNH